tara:strand:+ start:3350 stop:5236 length:1887 start_codon:yes stop_codon:yes gene_type:complete
MSAIKVPAIFTAIDKFSAPVQRMSKNMSAFAQKAEIGVARLDRSMRRLTPSIGSLGKQMLGFAATGALITGVGSAIRTIKDFEQANADLSAVMSSATKPQLKALADDAARLGGVTAKTATEVVGLQEAYARLGFETPSILNMTEATIAGSIAMNAELDETAELTGAMIRTFDKLKSTDARQVIDQMTLATQKSALNFEKLQTSLPIVAGASEAAGISFERTVALLGKLSDSGIDASSSATALRNIFLESAKEGLNYEQILSKIEKNQDKLTAANDQFGKRAAVSASILSKNIRSTQELTDVLEKTQKGQENYNAAQVAADKRLNTLSGSLTLLSSKWDGLLIAQNNNTGAVGIMTKAVQFLTNNLEIIVGTLAALVAGFVAFKLALFAAKSVLLAYNIILGVYGALSGTAAISVGANTAALTAYNIATKAAAFFTKIFTAAQWLLNVALNANPIGLIVIAVLALIAAVAIIIKKYDEWGAAATVLLGPFGYLISLVQEFRRNWDNITNAFASGSILSGIKEIAKTLASSVLNPLQQIFELLSKISFLGIGTVASGQIKMIDSIKDKLGIETPAINPKQAEQEALTQKIEETKNSNATLTVKAPKGTVDINQDEGFFPKITETVTGFFN